MARRPVANREFAALIAATGDRSVAERPLNPDDHPGAAPDMPKPGSIVFRPANGPTAKDSWLGPEKPVTLPAFYDLWWDPGEQYDIVFNGAAPTHGNQTSPGRYSGQDNGWIGLYINPVLIEFFEELKAYPNIPYQPWGEGISKVIPPGYR